MNPRTEPSRATPRNLRGDATAGQDVKGGTRGAAAVEPAASIVDRRGTERDRQSVDPMRTTDRYRLAQPTDVQF